MKAHTQFTRDNLTPADAVQILEEGNRRFVANLKVNRNLLQQVNETAEGQFPFAVILSCIDSRTSAELIFDQGLGDIFSVRVAGNVVNEDVLGCMEFACKLAGAKLIVVLGHSSCGAVKGACAGVKLGNLTGLLDKLQPAVAEVGAQRSDGGADPSQEFVDAVAEANIDHVIEQIGERSPVLLEMIERTEISVVGAMYDVRSGVVTFRKSAPATRE